MTVRRSFHAVVGFLKLTAVYALPSAKTRLSKITKNVSIPTPTEGVAPPSALAYTHSMSRPVRFQTDPDDDEAAELVALSDAVEKARANKRGIPHDEMRGWLLEIAAGDFDTPPPVARDL